MSYWVYLMKDNSPVRVKPHSGGGTYAAGGIASAELNITYNYSEVYHLFDFSIKDLHGKTAKDSITQLEGLVKKLGTCRFKDYWAPTPGNAGHALNILLGWAREYPDGVWEVS